MASVQTGPWNDSDAFHGHEPPWKWDPGEMTNFWLCMCVYGKPWNIDYSYLTWVLVMIKIKKNVINGLCNPLLHYSRDNIKWLMNLFRTKWYFLRSCRFIFVIFYVQSSNTYKQISENFDFWRQDTSKCMRVFRTFEENSISNLLF